MVIICIHFYGKDSRSNRNNIRQKLDKLQIKGGNYLYIFLQKKFGVKINLVGKGDESIYKIPYIKLSYLLTL